MNLTPIIKESFSQYGGAVLQSRALVDVRDCLKPSARQIFYCLYTDKFTSNKPFKKTLKAIGSAMRMYIHGDSSCEGIIMRAGQPFALRYPLIQVEGSYGNLMESGNWAAARYTSSRLTGLSDYLFKDIDKNTIDDWRDNYDDTEKYPAVLTTKGFYNIINGTSGIGVGAASSLPQFNIREVNEALIKLLYNPDIDFEEIYCAPDFATGAILLNEDEVKESLKNGNGKSCRLRSVVEYNEKERCFVVKEIPYGVYTNTICGQLEKLIENNIGIDRFNDLTGETPLIKIYLSKNANPERILRTLYKETSLQYHYGINMTMLDNGRFPRVFTWKEALQAYLTHELEVYRKGFEYDLKKLKDRLHIVEGILIALARIEEVIEVIKKSVSTAAARQSLQDKFLLSEVQAKAILDIKLARLAHLEVEKLEKERDELLQKISHIEEILANELLLKKEIEKDLQETAKKYGDARRTQILNLKVTEDDTPIEEKSLIVHLTNEGNLYTFESTTLITQRRGGQGIKVKMGKNEYITDTISDTNCAVCLAFSNFGKVYTFAMNDLPINSCVNFGEFFNLANEEKITTIVPFNKINPKSYVLFVTKNGMVKKSSLEEYKIKKSMGVIAVKLKDGDSLVSVMLVDKSSFGILTKQGKFVRIDTEQINPTGRATSGVIGIKLSNDDEVVDAKIIQPTAVELISVTNDGLIKRTELSNYEIGNRATKGSSIQKLKDNYMVSFNVLDKDDKEIIVVSNKGLIKIPISEVQLSTKGAIGTKAKKIGENEKVTELVRV